MAYCPQCLTEYVEGAVECMDCRVALRPGAPPPPTPSEEEPNVHFVPIRIFRGLQAQFEAELAHNVLEAEGIPSEITANLGAEMLPGADMVQLLVREDNQARASQFLKDFLEAPVVEQSQTSSNEVAESGRDKDKPA